MPEDSRIILLVILAAAAFVWLPNLFTIPHWDVDEGYNLNYARNIADGGVLWFSIKYAFVPHPPLYLLLLAALVRLFGESIEVIRVLSVVMNFVVIILLYLIGRVVDGRRAGLLAAGIFAVYPAAIYWGRMGFSNHLLSLMQLASLYCLVNFVRSGGRWWIFACAFAGLSPIVEPQGLFIAFALLIYFAAAAPRFLARASAVLLGPTLLFAAVLSAVSGYFVGDVLYQLQRFNLLKPQVLLLLPVIILVLWKRKILLSYVSDLFVSESRIIFGGRELLDNNIIPSALVLAHLLLTATLTRALTDEMMLIGGDYFWLGIIGLLFLNRVFLSQVVLLYFLPSFFAVLVFGRADHMLIPLYPFFALGLAIMLPWLYSFLREKVGVFLAFVVLLCPFALAVYTDWGAFVLGNMLPGEPVGDLQAVSAYVNNHNPRGGFVVTTTNLVRYLTNATPITQAVAYEGYKIEYYRGDYPPDRFVFNCSFRGARYAVLPNSTLGWLSGYAPGPAGDMERWRMVNASGGYVVLENPTSG